MTHDSIVVLDAVLRQNFPCFIHKVFQNVAPGQHFSPNWHIDTIAWQLEKCFHGETKRLLITLPPRNLKSIGASVAFPAWVLGHDPTKNIICVSYGQDLASKHGRDTRSVMQSSWYRRTFPGTRINPRKNTEAEMETTRRGFRNATSVGGSLTGRGGDILIIDDPSKPDQIMSEAERNAVKEWYDGTLYSRLNDRNNGVIIVIMQRLHEDDLVGHLLETGDWEHLDIPVIAEENCRYEIGDDRYYDRPEGEVLHEARESRENLETTRQQIGSYLFQAQYQQRPVPHGGNLIKREWLPTYKDSLHQHKYDCIVQSWDTASTVGDSSDYSVGITFGLMNATVHILDVVRVKLEYPYLRRLVIQQADQVKADTVLIERASSGLQLVQDLRREGHIRPISPRPEGDKVSRLEAHTAKLESGYILLPERGSWVEDFKAELLAFPNGRHDDQVDALTQFLDWYAGYVRNSQWRAKAEEKWEKIWQERKSRRRELTWEQRNPNSDRSNEFLIRKYGDSWMK
jgi:predicted phage terminase large subunit-like protein